MMRLAGLNVVISSNEPWGDVWYSKHNYAYELSKRNKVLFLDPQPRWRPHNILGCRISTKRISDTLTIVSFNNILPILNRTLFRINNLLVSAALRRFFRRAGFDRPFFWAFDPHRLYDPRRLGAEFSIYHSVDPYKLVPYGEAALCRNADLVLAVKEEIAADYRSLVPLVHVIPHAISSDDFVVGADPADLPPLPPPGFGLYIGAIDKRLDFALLEHMLSRFPAVPFLFIGPLALDGLPEATARLFTIRRFPNLHHLPVVPYKNLKFIIEKARFCLAINTVLPPRGERFTAHKMLQYLAMGKPVFLSAPTAHEEGLVYTSRSHQSFVDGLARFLETDETPEKPAERIAYAKRHTFEAAFERIEALIALADSDRTSGRA